MNDHEGMNDFRRKALLEMNFERKIEKFKIKIGSFRNQPVDARKLAVNDGD